MKKTMFVCLLAALLLTIPAVTLGLNSPSVSEDHGVITGMFVTNTGLVAGVEYGLTSDFAVFGSYDFKNQPKLGLKYELNPNLALTGGINGFSPMSPFLGINASAGLVRNLSVLGEVEVSLAGSQFVLQYEGGLKFNLSRQVDLRGGVIGSTAGSGVNFELGIGYKY